VIEYSSPGRFWDRVQIGSGAHPASYPKGTSALSLAVERPGREADLPPSSAEVKNAWSYTFAPQHVFMAWCLVKHRNNFTFTFTFTGQRISDDWLEDWDSNPATGRNSIRRHYDSTDFGATNSIQQTPRTVTLTVKQLRR